MKTKKNTKVAASSNNIAKLVASLGGITRSCNDVRHCSRCNQPLTDPASWERGIGPICAKKDTHLFAKTIPANFTLATAHAIGVKIDMLPAAVRPVWTALHDFLFEKSESAMNAAANAGNFTFHFSGEDCRQIAKVIDFMLSFAMDRDNKHHLIQIVKHLGFIGLAGVLSGQSSTGEAELKFENGKLFLTGSSNKAGFNAMRVIHGIVVPRKRAGGAYEAPAAQYEKFIAACMEFWPCFDGKVDEIVEQCKAWIAANPVAVAAQKQLTGKPVAHIINRSTDFTLKFDWNKAVTRRLVDEIKNIPAKERSYDAASKLWAINKQHRDSIVKLFGEHYDILECDGGETPVAAAKKPAYRPNYGGRGYGRNYYYAR
jgi:hypothetical protein